MSIPTTLAPNLKLSHRRALMATARIACVAALVGCAPKTVSPVGPAAETPVSTESVPFDDQDQAASTASVASCEETVEAAFADSADPTAVGDDIKACCQTIAEAVDADPSEDTFAFAHREECCTALDWRGSMACTPWGPPTPPAMTA